MNSLSFIPKFIYEHCISLQNALGDNIDKKTSNWFAVLISTNPFRFELYLKDDFVKTQNSDYPMLEWGDKSKMLFKLWQTNKWIDQKSGQYLLCSNHNVFVLNEPTKKAIGSLAGACRTHGDIYDVYSLTPINVHAITRQRVRPVEIVLTDSLENRIAKYKLPTIDSVVQQEDIFIPNENNIVVENEIIHLSREDLLYNVLYLISANDQVFYMGNLRQ